MENENVQQYRIIQRHEISNDTLTSGWSFSESWIDTVIERMKGVSIYWDVTKELRFNNAKNI